MSSKGNHLLFPHGETVRIPVARLEHGKEEFAGSRIVAVGA